VRDGQTLIRTYGSYDAEDGARQVAQLQAEDVRLARVIDEKNRELAGNVPQCFVENEAELREREDDLSKETESARQQAALLATTRGQIKALAQNPGPDAASLRDQEREQARWTNEYEEKARQAAAKVEAAKAALAACDDFKAKSEKIKWDAEFRRAAIHEQRAEMDRLRSRARVYVDFWKSELEWASRAGLLAR
jgi:hypothetical protein